MRNAIRQFVRRVQQLRVDRYLQRQQQRVDRQLERQHHQQQQSEQFVCCPCRFVWNVYLTGYRQ